MIKNNKGFTLIEVLVSITIMGIITAIALPEVQQLQSKNREKKFVTYEDSLKSSARLYVDSNAVDLFGYREVGCAIINYRELKAKALVKDYATNGITCANNDTFVVVNKSNGKYTYDVHIKCTKDGKLEYESYKVTKCDGTSSTGRTPASEDNTGGSTGGNTGGSTGGNTGGSTGGNTGGSTGGDGSVDFSVSVEDASKYTKIKGTTTFTITTTSKLGLSKNLQLSYYLAKDSEGKELLSGTSGMINFYNNGEPEEKTITQTINQISAGDYTGIAYLIVDPQNVCSKSTCKVGKKAIALKFDNTGPIIDPVNGVVEKKMLIGKKLKITWKEEESGIDRWTYEYPDEASNVGEQDYIESLAPYTRNPFVTTAFTIAATNKRVLIRAYDKAGNVTVVEHYITVI